MSHALRRPGGMAALTGIVTSIVIATGAVAAGPSWQTPIDLRVKDGVTLTDAAFADQNVALVWTEPGDGVARNMGLSVSTNAGTHFQTRRMFERSEQGAVAICDGWVDVAFVRHAGTNKWLVEHARGELAGGYYEVTRIAGGAGRLRQPDIACTDGRLFVSWLRKKADGWRRFVTTALLDDGVFGPPIDLGIDTSPYFPRGLVLAASERTAYALFGGSDGRLRMKRWTDGTAPGYPLTPRATETVAPGTSHCPAESPVIAADGDTVAIAWDRNSGFGARVSTDRGASWGPIRDVTGIECGAIVEGGASPVSLSVSGSHMVLTGIGCGFFDCTSSMTLTNDGFVNYSAWNILGDDQSHVVGYVVVNGKVKLADAFSTAFRVRFRRQT